MTSVKQATPTQDKEGVFAARNPTAAAFAVRAGYAVPYITEEAKFAAAQAAYGTCTKSLPGQPKV